MISRNLYFHLFYDLVLFCILHSFHQMIFLYISWSFCKIIVSFFFLFSLPCLLFSHSNAAETYLLQFMMSFLWRWERGQIDHVVWHLVDVGCDDDGEEEVGTIMKKALMVVTMKMLSGVSINMLSEVRMKICCQ